MSLIGFLQGSLSPRQQWRGHLKSSSRSTSKGPCGITKLTLSWEQSTGEAQGLDSNTLETKLVPKEKSGMGFLSLYRQRGIERAK